MQKAILGLVVFAVLSASPVKGRAQEQGRELEVWTWQGRVEPGRSFRLSSINGPVSVEASSDNQVHVRAEKVVRRSGTIRDVAFMVVPSGGDVHICALWRETDECTERGLRSDSRGDRNDRGDVQVRFTVRVPRGVHLAASTVNGEMRVRDMSGSVRARTVNGAVDVANSASDVDASTVNGQVRITTAAGPVSASTVNGSIHARMASLRSDGDMKFNTVNGGITLELPAALDANVSLDTMHGGIQSDYPVQLSGRFGPRHASGTIGRGGRRIALRTVNGTVELRKLN